MLLYEYNQNWFFNLPQWNNWILSLLNCGFNFLFSSILCAIVVVDWNSFSTSLGVQTWTHIYKRQRAENSHFPSKAIKRLMYLLICLTWDERQVRQGRRDLRAYFRCSRKRKRSRPEVLFLARHWFFPTHICSLCSMKM